MFPLYLILHVKVYSFYLSLVRVCTKIFIYKLFPYQQGCVLSLLIKFDITSQKGEKELKVIFSNLIKALLHKDLQSFYHQ
jgi:hypothetical protein